MLEFKTVNTGAKVIINIAPYKKFLALKTAILHEIKESPLGVKLIKEQSDKNVLDSKLDFTGFMDFLKNSIIGLDISEKVNEALFDCLTNCTYNMQKITLDLFDTNPEIREDEYEIKLKCIEENFRPFVKSLASQWSILAPKIGESQALNVILAQMSR